jgi:predicted permease
MAGFFLEVITQVTLPIILTAALGFIMQRRLRLDVSTLNRLLIYVTLPAFLLHSLSNATLPLAQVQDTAIFTLLQFLAFLTLGLGLGRLLGLGGPERGVVALAFAFPNSGNYGIPVVELAFGSDYVLHQAVITGIHSILIFTLGPLVLSGRLGGWREAVSAPFRTPLIPAVVIGLLLNATGTRLPQVLDTPLELIGSAYIAIALFALGAQLALADWSVLGRVVGWAAALRLAVAPLLTALVLLALADLPSDVTQLLIVGACAPVGVLLPILCAEYGADARLASAGVIVTTVLSPLLVTLTLLAFRLF